MQVNTIDYYNQNAASFVESTVNVDFESTQQRFLQLIPAKGYILDLGCGSGRDTKYFLEQGFNVDATDGSEELVQAARAYTGIDVKCMLFNELNVLEKYDGIWACSSILHLPKVELKPVLYKMAAAIKPKGVIYTSFKYGDFEGERNGRFFTDFTEKSFVKFMRDVPELVIEGYWITSDVRPGRDEEKWLNVIMRRTD